MSLKVNPPSLFFLEFSGVFLLLCFVIVRNLESLWWLWRYTAQISFQENMPWEGKRLLLSCCPWLLLACDEAWWGSWARPSLPTWGSSVRQSLLWASPWWRISQSCISVWGSSYPILLFHLSFYRFSLASWPEGSVHLFLSPLYFITHRHFPNRSLAHLILFWHQQDAKFEGCSLFS